MKLHSGASEDVAYRAVAGSVVVVQLVRRTGATVTKKPVPGIPSSILPSIAQASRGVRKGPQDSYADTPSSTASYELRPHPGEHEDFFLEEVKAFPGVLKATARDKFNAIDVVLDVKEDLTMAKFVAFFEDRADITALPLPASAGKR